MGVSLPWTGAGSRSLSATIIVAFPIIANMAVKDVPRRRPLPPLSPSFRQSGIADIARELSAPSEEFPPRLLEERAGLDPGTGGAAMRIATDALYG